jgi:multicomponent K+:H+ antiporter subunit D
MLSAVITSGANGYANAPGAVAWWVLGAIVASGFAALIALTRMGVKQFWAEADTTPTSVRPFEATPVAFLLVLLVALTAFAQPIMRYTAATGASLRSPVQYLSSVLPTPEAPAAPDGEH